MAWMTEFIGLASITLPWHVLSWVSSSPFLDNTCASYRRSVWPCQGVGDQSAPLTSKLLPLPLVRSFALLRVVWCIWDGVPRSVSTSIMSSPEFRAQNAACVGVRFAVWNPSWRGSQITGYLVQYHLQPIHPRLQGSYPILGAPHEFLMSKSNKRVRCVFSLRVTGTIQCWACFWNITH